MRTDYVVGLDAGGSKTLGVAATPAGEVIAVCRSGPGNYQTIGVDRAHDSLRECIAVLVRVAARASGCDSGRCLAAYLAVAGADRSHDFQVIRGYVGEVMASDARCDLWEVDNDALAALALASDDGCGIVAICGTGTNCVGVGPPPGRARLQIGGLGRAFGDAAGGSEIGIRALAAAVRCEDGRGPHTALTGMFRAHLGLQSLMELADVIQAGKRQLSPASLVPLVVEAAERRDEAAIKILADCGQELGLSALAALRRLYPLSACVPVVLTGGVVINPNPIIRDAAAAVVLREYPFARMITLAQPPALGSVARAARLVGIQVTRAWIEALSGSYNQLKEHCAGETEGHE